MERAPVVSWTEMPSLRQILEAHSPLLLLDAASARIQVGLLDAAGMAEGRARWADSGDEAGVALFRCVESLGADPSAVRAFAFADSPGSVLGIRTAAMAVRVWCAIAPRPVFAYSALALLAEASKRPEVTFIADARRDAWHACRRGETPARVPTSSLAGPLAMPEGFRNWTPLPGGVESVPYGLSDLWPRARDADILLPAGEPDAFLHEEPQYATWEPRIHRAPSP